MRKSCILILLFLFVSSFAFGQESNRSFSLGLSTGMEGIVRYYFPSTRNSEYYSKGVLMVGFVETFSKDNVELFLSQYYSNVYISQENQSTYHSSYTSDYSGSYLTLPLGLDIRLSKNKNVYFFISGAYRVDFAFNQILTNGMQESKMQKFALARQTVEAGSGMSFKISDVLQFKFRASFVFKPFYNENILLKDVADSRLKISISLSKCF